MEPILLVCGGCGVRIRSSDPEKVRARDCPRCRSPLAPAVDRALGLDLIVEARLGELAPAGPTPARRWPAAAAALLVAVVFLAGLAVRDASTGSNAPTPVIPNRPISAATETASISRPAETRAIAPPVAVGDEGDAAGAMDDAPAPIAPPSRDLAILDGARRDPIFSPAAPPDARPHPGPIDRPTPPPPTQGDPTGSASNPIPSPPVAEPGPSAEPRRLLVRDGRGRSVVAREYGMLKGRPAAILPDGQIGWPESLVFAEDPFVPASRAEMERSLRADPEFAGFRFNPTAHYLVAYEGSEPFARASGELLEKLNDGLTGMLRRNGLAIAPMEFPLVAVIFATEDHFRANRRVAPDVQAYYEILSNRIFFYEKSSRDQDAPEVSALRKPQTVAHEGTHQILHNVGIQPRLADWPIWLVEGLAEYCSSTRFTKRGLAEWAGLGQVNSIHLATIRDLDDPVPNQFRGGRREAVVLRDRGTPLVEHLVTRKELTPTDYALSWALTHYLANQRLDELVAYIKRMSRLRPFEERSPAEQLADFREAFGGDLSQLDGKVGKYLKKFKPTDALPHYAVIFEQPVGPTSIRRHYMVSQSPSVIRQWIESVTAPEGGESRWHVVPHATQKQALEAADQWINSGR